MTNKSAYVGAMVLLAFSWALISIGTEMVWGLGIAFIVAGALIFVMAVLAARAAS